MKKDLSNGLLISVAGIALLSQALGIVSPKDAMLSSGISLLLVGIHYIAHAMSWCGCERGVRKR